MNSDPSVRQGTDTALLNWLEQHPQCEVSHDGWDDPPLWRVHQVTGGRNDREWNEVASGETVREAIQAAQKEMKRRGR